MNFVCRTRNHTETGCVYTARSMALGSESQKNRVKIHVRNGDSLNYGVRLLKQTKNEDHQENKMGLSDPRVTFLSKNTHQECVL